MDGYIRCVACVFVRAYVSTCIFRLRCMCLCVRALSFMRWARFYEEETSKALKEVNVATGCCRREGAPPGLYKGFWGAQQTYVLHCHGNIMRGCVLWGRITR